MESSQIRVTPFDRLQLALFKSQVRRMNGEQSRLQTLRVGLAFASLVTVQAIDLSDAHVDMCTYQIDGTGEGPDAILAGLDIDFVQGTEDLISGECRPSLVN